MTWRSCDANRAPSTFVHIVVDNAWRRQTQFSMPLLAVGHGRDCCLLFSIPAKNVASCRQSSQVYIAYSDEKCTITRSHITDSDGNISLFQLLWKGTTDLYTGNCWTRYFAKFRSGLISHSGLKVVWGISHEFEKRNIPRRNNPAAKSPPPLYGIYQIRLDITSQSVNYEFMMHQRAAGNTQHLSGHRMQAGRFAPRTAQHQQ